ncbi:ribosome maturation factor RimP [Desulfuribacillus alkaliarsenatis]|uniref:Ribosome maturation factor RimP n=1 Tax=Desulfuribacillus alkaliarsenatis TaxID=766136 RepID=A0A1E5G637_9FIRM|nr:ribosome maturation factor RimP [Desulfuribacillus alkaliarsenatis]OEF98642.1 ribosome maturation factor RimP [Desulfuribacillus alkaliarsenatis]
MANVERIIKLIESIAKPIVEKEQLDLVDVEFTQEGANWFLRVIIDKEGGIDIDDCGRISEQVSKKLDELDPIEESYFLEVCSPGAEKPLKNADDIQAAINEYVYVKTNKPIEDSQEFVGTILNFENNILTLKLDKKQLEIPYNDIDKIRLEIKF